MEGRWYDGEIISDLNFRIGSFTKDPILCS